MIQVAVPLPFKDQSINQTNRHVHWAKYQNAKKQHQTACQVKLIEAGVKSLPVPLVIDYEFFCGWTMVIMQGRKKRLRDKFYRPTDRDNARSAMKGFQDLLTEMKLIPNDTARFVHDGTVKINSHKESKGQQGVIVTFREAQ